MKSALPVLCAVFLASAAAAETPEVRAVEIHQHGMDWRVDVTLLHGDTGWDHYADGWEVLDAAGNRLGLRELHHPHVHEQPFTRSLHNVGLPDGTREVYIRARCSVDGWGSELTAVPVALEP